MKEIMVGLAYVKIYMIHSEYGWYIQVPLNSSLDTTWWLITNTQTIVNIKYNESQSKYIYIYIYIYIKLTECNVIIVFLV